MSTEFFAMLRKTKALRSHFPCVCGNFSARIQINKTKCKITGYSSNFVRFRALAGPLFDERIKIGDERKGIDGEGGKKFDGGKKPHPPSPLSQREGEV